MEHAVNFYKHVVLQDVMEHAVNFYKHVVLQYVMEHAVNKKREGWGCFI